MDNLLSAARAFRDELDRFIAAAEASEPSPPQLTTEEDMAFAMKAKLIGEMQG